MGYAPCRATLPNAALLLPARTRPLKQAHIKPTASPCSILLGPISTSPCATPPLPSVRLRRGRSRWPDCASRRCLSRRPREREARAAVSNYSIYGASARKLCSSTFKKYKLSSKYTHGTKWHCSRQCKRAGVKEVSQQDYSGDRQGKQKAKRHARNLRRWSTSSARAYGALCPS